MLIRVINPNSTSRMTELIGRCATSVAGAGTRIEAVNPLGTPPAIESHYDEARSVPAMLDLIEDGERSGVDGYVLACFGDPGLEAAREVASGPVVGIAEAAMHAASVLGGGFSVVTTLGRTLGRAEELLLKYGMERRCRGVHACEVPVLGLEDPGSRTLLADACRQALRSDRSDVIVLGCAGMTAMCAELSDELGVPVVDGVAAATTWVQALVTQGLRTSTRSEFAPPASLTAAR